LKIFLQIKKRKNMRANEFEKQVQNQLDDLQLSPSASVWKNVEAQIRKRKRRRTIFFFILPLLLLLGGYSIYQFNVNQESHSAADTGIGNKDQQTSQKADISTGELENNPVARKENPVGINNHQNQNNPSSTKHDLDPGKINTQLDKPDHRIDQPSRPATDNPHLPSAPGKEDRMNPKNTSKPDSKKPGNIRDGNGQSNIETITPVAGKITAPVTNTNENPAASDRALPVNPTIKSLPKDTVAANDTAFAVLEPTDKDTEVVVRNTEEKTKIRVAPIRKIRWGADMSAGLVSNQTSLLSLEKSFAPNRDSYNGSPISGGAGNPMATSPPSTVEAGPAFKIGAVAEVQVSKRSRFSVGLQYVYLSNRIKTGSKKDTLIMVPTGLANNFAVQVDQIYRGSPQEDFTNRYHFISIPVFYHLQVNKGKKLPMQLNIGASASYMVATNALVYSGGLGGIYFHDKEMFNKMFVNLSTGFSVRLKSSGGTEWVFGPEFSMALDPLIRGEKEQYLLYGGVGARMLFAKKKK
jgi:hypothetical protein